MKSIREFIPKIKVFLEYPPSDLLIVAVVVLVGLGSFGLGRLSVLEYVDYPVEIVSPESNQAVVQKSTVSVENSEGVTSESISGEVVASKNGTKYHFPWCGGAKQIAEKNKVTFASIQEAREAGYTPASNCKGLE